MPLPVQVLDGLSSIFALMQTPDADLCVTTHALFGQFTVLSMSFSLPFTSRVYACSKLSDPIPLLMG